MIFRTTDLCDANEGIIGHGVQIAAPVFKNFGGRNVFSGQIETLKLFEDNLLLRNVVSESGKGKVLVVDVGGLMRFGVIGDMIAELAHLNDWQGVVVNGCVRDSVALKSVDIGVCALGVHPQRSAKKGLGERGSSVHFWDVTFNPGEYLYCDEDGIVVSSKSLI